MFDTFSREAQSMLDRLRLDWERAEYQSGRGEGRIAIVGLPGTGKKTLCNSLWGWQALSSDLPEETVRKLGLFTLITPPEDAYDESTALYHLESAELVIYLLDAVAGPRAEDIRWMARLRALPAALIIVLNKANLAGEALTPDVLGQLQDQFARPVLPLNALDVDAVHEQFLSQVLKACPPLAVPLAAEITSLRWRVVGRLIRESAVLGGLVTLENGATVDIHALIELQRRLVKQIARIYGYADPNEVDQAGVLAVVQRLVLDYAAGQLGRWGTVGRGLAASLIGSSGAWAVGRTAQAHYTGQKLPDWWRNPLRRNGHHGNGTPRRV